MDSIELRQAMMSDSVINQIFIGVYPINMIPKVLPIPLLMIVNHDKSTEPGSHWIVLHFKDNNIVEHFDSLGKKPVDSIHNLLITNWLTYKYNNKRLQNYNSYTCGLYCLYYSHLSSRNQSFNKIVGNFTSNLKQNDEIVKDFYQINF